MRTIFGLLALLFFSSLRAQDDEKIESLPFCGWEVKNKKAIRERFEEQYNFLAPQKGDTIVDIGAASGTYEGCLAAGFDLSGVHFVLVDVDARCLNRRKVENMRRFYSAVKGDSIRNGFDIVVNTQDSLRLPLGRYRKVWLLNTLHELSSPEKMARDIAAVLLTDGELCVLELLPRKEGQLHGGCNKPLLKAEQIKAIFCKNGFRLEATKALAKMNRFDPVMYRFRKE